MAVYTVSDSEGTPALSCGLDIVELATIEEAIDMAGDEFLNNIYTRGELDACRDRLASLAALFAAKEAVSKTLGTGFEGFSWLDIEILPDGDGGLEVHFSGPAALRAATLSLRDWTISVSWSRSHAIASVLAYEGNVHGD